MRTDVKIGIVISVIAVGMAAYYFSLPGDEDVRLVGGAQLVEGPSGEAGDGASGGRVPSAPEPGEADSQGRVPAAQPAAAQTSEQDEAGRPGAVEAPTAAGEGAKVPSIGVATSATPGEGVAFKAEDRPRAPGQLAQESPPTVDISLPAVKIATIEQKDKGPAGKSEPPPLPARTDGAKSGVETTAGSVEAASAAAPEGAAGPAKPEAKAKTHTVQPGETFARLAVKYYGSERYTRFLLKENPQISDPRMLKAGDKVRIPPPAEAQTAASPRVAALKPGQKPYTVKENDTFYAIAARTLGDGTRWPEIYELNRDLVGDHPTNLRAGQVLALPKGAEIPK